MSLKIEWHGDVVRKDLIVAVELCSFSIAKSVARTARNLAPVKSGALKRSIIAKKSKFKGGGAIIKAGGGDEYYASFIEFGRKNAAAHPFLRPALEKNRARAIRKIKKALRDKMK